MNEEKELNSNKNQIPMPESAQAVPPKNKFLLVWVLIGGLGVIWLVLLGVFFLIPGKQPEVVKLPGPKEVVTVTPSLDVGAPLSQSDEVSAVESDINNSDFSMLDSELSSIEAELPSQ